MNIQIFGLPKCFDTKKAERFFKERNIKFQSIDLKQKAMSQGELKSVLKAIGGSDHLINENAKDRALLALIKYLSEEDKLIKIMENPQIYLTPIVRNGNKATIGYQPETWSIWDKE